MLEYWFIMHKEEFYINKWNKTSENHILKEMFLGRTWRTNLEHSTSIQQHDNQTRLDMDKSKACACWKSCKDQ